MKSKIEETVKTIKVVLVGNSEQKRAFMSAFDQGNVRSIVIDFIMVPGKSGNVKYQIWDLAGHEVFRIITNVYLKGAHAFVYLNPNEAMKVLYESKRDENQTIAIDYDALKLTPKECINEIENLIAAYPIEIAKQERIHDKAVLVFQSHTDKKSIFSYLPKELTASISQLMVASKSPVFGSTDKPIYIGLPQTKKPEVKTEERQENSCVIS